jgi:predicted lactoylglutathione lyase
MKDILLWICVVLTLFYSICAESTMVLRELANHMSQVNPYVIGSRITDTSKEHEILISVKQNNKEILKEIVNDISNVLSSNYGQLLMNNY